MDSVGERYASETWYRPRTGLIPDSMNPAPREYFLPRRGITLRDPFDERVDHRGRVSPGTAACNEISPTDE
jgi:hypothetical protein